MPEINFTKVQLQPEVENPLQGPVTINIFFTSKSDVSGASFYVKLFIDYVLNKIPRDLLTYTQDIKTGENNITLEVPFGDDVKKDINAGIVANIGKLSISISSGETEIGKIDLITDIKNKKGTLYKTIYDPFE